MTFTYSHYRDIYTHIHTLLWGTDKDIEHTTYTRYRAQHIHNKFLNTETYVVKLHSKLADSTQLQLVGVEVDFVFPCHKKEERKEEGRITLT